MKNQSNPAGRIQAPRVAKRKRASYVDEDEEEESESEQDDEGEDSDESLPVARRRSLRSAVAKGKQKARVPSPESPEDNQEDEEQEEQDDEEDDEESAEDEIHVSTSFSTTSEDATDGSLYDPSE